MPDYKLNIIITGKDLASGAIKGVGGALGGLGKAALAGAAVAVGAITGIGVAIAKLTIDAAPLQQIEAAFMGIADSAGVGGAAMLTALQRSSVGMVGQRDLMLSFNKASQLISADFAVQLPEAMQYMGKVAASTGMDMAYLMDSLVLGVGRMSPKILDNLAIQVTLADATLRASEMFGVEEGALTKTQQQMGMMNVVMEKLAINTAAMPGITGTAAAGLGQLTTFFQDAGDAIGLLFLPVLNELVSFALPVLRDALPPLLEGLGGLAEKFLNIASIVTGFFQRLTEGVDPLTSFKVLLMNLLPADMFARAMEIVDSIVLFVEQVQLAVGPVAAWLAENVGLQDVLIGLGTALAIVIVPAIASVVSAVGGVVLAFALGTAAAAALRQAWETNFLGIRDIAADVWGWLQVYIPQALTAIQTTFNTVVAAIQAFWAAHGEEIMATAAEIWEGVVAVFDWFVGQWTKVYEAFALAFSGDWRGFGEKLREVWDEAWAQISRIGADAWENIKGFFTSTDWGAVGRGILEGIASGISSGVDFLKDAVRDAARAALDAAKGFLGIHSPSSLFASEVGYNISLGMAQGILSGINLPAGAAQQMAQTTYDRSRSVTVNMQPTQYQQVGPTIGDDLRYAALTLGAA